MKLIVGCEIFFPDRGYFLTYEEIGKYAWNDREIINTLKMQPHDFFTILHKNGGEYNYTSNNYRFKNISDIVKTIEELEPYLIMEEIIK